MAPFALSFRTRPRDSDAVKTSLDHLPEGKRRELAFVVDTVRQGMAERLVHRSTPARRDGKLLKIILYGSYARGDWVDDPVGRYFSDYDLLIVVNCEELTDGEDFWRATEEELLAELSAGTNLRTPVSLIVHSLNDVNEKLRLGRYFFVDIVRDGIVLFEEPGHSFEKPQKLSPAQALQETQAYFDEWFESANDFLQGFRDAEARGKANLAAFLLHQTAERFYHCLFLVRTLYSPKTHNLNRLRQQAEEIEPRLKEVWPRATKLERQSYARLQEAYVKARYSREYRISAEQLTWLGERVERLKQLVGESCDQRLAYLREAA